MAISPLRTIKEPSGQIPGVGEESQVDFPGGAILI
jgi:hypothetical protein